MKRSHPKTRAFYRRRRRKRSAALSETWPPGAKKPWGTPGRRYEVRVAGAWRPARVRNKKPVEGGWYLLGPRALARIIGVREAR